MKEMKIEDELILTAVKKKIWTILDMLRLEHISSEDYSVILFLLSAFKDGLISQDLIANGHQIKQQLLVNIYNLRKENELYEQYPQIVSSFEPVLQRLSVSGLRDICKNISEINEPVLIKNFPQIFDSILFHIADNQRTLGAEFIQPIELTRLMSGLVTPKIGAKIYNPFAGVASFAVNIDQGQHYFGQEINKRSWSIGMLRLMAYKKTNRFNLTCENSILQWPIENKFDLIISHPPFRMRLWNEEKIYLNEMHSYDFVTVEPFLIENGLLSLKPNGKLIILVPQGILYNGLKQDKMLRKHLVDADLIDTIISFPSGLLFNTSIPVAVLILAKEKHLPGKVRLIDAQIFVQTNASKQKVLNDYELSNIVHSDKQDDTIIRIIDNADICSNDYNLSVPRYFRKSIKGKKLYEILDLLKGPNKDLPEIGRFVRIRDLKDDNVDFILTSLTIDEVELKQSGIRMITEDCLLVAMRWHTLKPTYFKFQGEPIFVSNDILAFKVNKSIAEITFLINELHTDYVKEQLDAFRVGANIPFIKKDDLLQVVIKLPSTQEQRAKVQGIYELTDKIKALQQQQETIINDKSARQFNEFASLKHTLGRPRQNILAWSMNLLDFFQEMKKEAFELMNRKFAETYEIDIVNALKEIKHDVTFMTDVLEKGENGLILSEHKKEEIPLSEINNLINNLSNNGLNFRMNKLLLKGEKLKERGLYINKILFRTLLDNILTNANKYAFEKLLPNNEVRIALSEEDDFFIMEISNNGKRFPNNFDRKKFITKYSTADTHNGSGLGGYDINRIASDFNNPDWELILNEDILFPVKFRFKIQVNFIN